MAPELVQTDSNHPCTKPKANILRSEFVPQDMDSSMTDSISESITQLPSPKVTEDYAPSLPDLNVTEDYVPSPLSKFLALEEKILGDLVGLQQTCHALHTELHDALTYKKVLLSSDTVVRYDVSSSPQEEVVLFDVSMPHYPPVSDGEMYADTG